MKAETLKKSILQYAMEGKLIPQNPNDEPASELLKRIKAEKEQLIKEGKIKKEKLLPPIAKDEIPFEIPNNWVWTRLGEVLFKLTDGSHSTPKYVNKGIPFLSVKDLSKGNINFSNTKYISEEEHKILYKRCNPEVGDILLTKVGTTGIPVIVNTDKEFSLFVSVALLKFNQNLIYNCFLKYLILSPLVQKQATENTKGIGNKNWVIKDILNTIILLPPFEEQKRIVEKLEEILPFVDEYGKNELILSEMNSNLSKQIRQSILQYAVQGKLVEQNPNDEPASELLKRIKAEKEQLIKEGKLKKEKPLPPIAESEIPFDIPENWKWVRLYDLCTILGDGIHGTPEYTLNTSYYFINGNNLNNGRIDIKSSTKTVSESEYLKYKKNLNKNTVLVSINGTLGNVAFYNNESVMLGKSACYFNLLNYIDKSYIKLVLNSDMFLKYADKVATGTTIKNVSLKAMKEFCISLPPFEEQKRIVAKVEELMKIVDKLEITK